MNTPVLPSVPTPFAPCHAAMQQAIMVAQALRSRGFSVAINNAYKGVALISRLGRPAEHRHSLQIEVHRGLYLDEATCKRSAGFGALQAALAGVAQDIAACVRTQVK